MNELAKELNSTLKGCAVYDLLSEKGKRMYFPKGIVAQSNEAGEKAKKYNATIGAATTNGEPFCLSDIYDQFKDGALKKSEVFSYAPGGGDKELRALWHDMILEKNPLLNGKNISETLVTAGLTHGISMIANLFVGDGDEVVLPNLYWDNYELIFRDLCGAELREFDFFKDGDFNVDGMKEALLSVKGDKARIILNFPNNPTGYTPSREMMQRIVKALKEVAESGKKILVICDDAYFGLFFESETEKCSLFQYLVDLDENIVAVKGDAATKEEMVWGFRIGFITYGGKGLGKEELGALVQKTLGAIRCTVSNCDRPGQSLIKKAFKSGKNHKRDKEILFDEMKRRYNRVKKALESHRESRVLTPYPFNSGYFMAFDTNGRDAEELRRIMLDRHQIGLINILGNTIRLAYCSVEESNIEDLINTLYSTAEDIWG